MSLPYKLVSSDKKKILLKGRLRHLERVQATIMHAHGAELFAKKIS